MLEEKIKVIQYAKNDELLEKYNLELITKFIEKKLSNVAETFAESKLKQVRVLLCSIFPGGMPYGQNGFVNTPISPFYQAILDVQHTGIPSGGEAGIRTQGPPYGRQLISSELHSTTLAPLHIFLGYKPGVVSKKYPTSISPNLKILNETLDFSGVFWFFRAQFRAHPRTRNAQES